jgi:predicted ATPase
VKRYVLTGGHGVGKSSIIAALEQRGEHVVHEAAATVRDLARARGEPFPEDSADFESRALSVHLQRESRVAATARRVFLDRGAPDHMAYSRAGSWPLTKTELAACRSARYDLAFLAEPPSSGLPTVGRVEAAFCRRLVAAIEDIYAELGVTVVRLPYRPVDERVALILHTVRAVAATLAMPTPPGTIRPHPKRRSRS